MNRASLYLAPFVALSKLPSSAERHNSPCAAGKAGNGKGAYLRRQQVGNLLQLKGTGGASGQDDMLCSSTGKKGEIYSWEVPQRQEDLHVTAPEAQNGVSEETKQHCPGRTGQNNTSRDLCLSTPQLQRIELMRKSTHLPFHFKGVLGRSPIAHIRLAMKNVLVSSHLDSFPHQAEISSKLRACKGALLRKITEVLAEMGSDKVPTKYLRENQITIKRCRSC